MGANQKFHATAETFVGSNYRVLVYQSGRDLHTKVAVEKFNALSHFHRLPHQSDRDPSGNDDEAALDRRRALIEL
jgi:hypothetical protein